MKRTVKNLEMRKTDQKFFFVVFVLSLMVAALFSSAGCDQKEAPMRADVSVSLVDRYDMPIADTEITVQGLSDMDMAIYITDPYGRFTVKSLMEKTITVIIYAEEDSYKTSYTVTKDDLARGEITIKFMTYAKGMLSSF